MSRLMKIVSSSDQRINEFTFNGTNWDDLKELIRESYPQLDNMKAIGRVSRVTYEQGNALIDERDSVIFLTPIKTKGGWDGQKRTKDGKFSTGSMKKTTKVSKKAVKKVVKKVTKSSSKPKFPSNDDLLNEISNLN
jgi:hypothetical protein